MFYLFHNVYVDKHFDACNRTLPVLHHQPNLNENPTEYYFLYYPKCFFFFPTVLSTVYFKILYYLRNIIVVSEHIAKYK